MWISSGAASIHVDIVADVYAQGFSAIVPMLRQFKGVNMLCDIGNGTMNIMTIQDRRAVMDQCFTEKYGTYQCMLRAREALTQRFGRTVPDAIIDEVLRNGDADIGRDYVDTIREAAAGYAAEIMRRLREHEYDPQTCACGSLAAADACCATSASLTVTA